MNETYVIDGSNVCWWYAQSHPEEISSTPLLSVLIALLEHGDDFYCVFDAPVTHEFEKHGKKDEAALIEQLLTEHPKKFFRVTGSTRADGVILHYADHNNRHIITNDIYRDYREKYDWLEDKYSPRLIQGNLQHSGLLTLDKLPYGQLELAVDGGKSAVDIPVVGDAKIILTALAKEVEAGRPNMVALGLLCRWLGFSPDEAGRSIEHVFHDRGKVIVNFPPGL